MRIVHVVFRFDYGGLENGLVNLVNGPSADSAIDHVIVALTEATEFSSRVGNNAQVYELHKRPGKDFGCYVRLFRLLKELKPDIVHTRNFGTIDCTLVAWAAGVPIRIHGEHGWDIYDPQGTRRKYRLLRRFFGGFVHKFVTVSEDLRRWLVDHVRIAEHKVVRIHNGVDTKSFQPADGYAEPAPVVIGSVTRFSEIKDPLNLVEAFATVFRRTENARLLMVGNGELYDSAVARIKQLGLTEVSELPGARDDIAFQLQRMDVFVLGSLKEGISNTILEAMSSGLPIVATNTGGNPELVEPGRNGALVSPGNCDELAGAIVEYIENSAKRVAHGRHSRKLAMEKFSLSVMRTSYLALYQEIYARRLS